MARHESGWHIPGDWDAEAWRCIQIQWPDSPDYLRLLMGLLYTLTRGRAYDRSSGTITEAQAVGWQIFDRNFPFSDCAEAENGDAPQQVVNYLVGGGIVVMEDNMGQVVTNVTYDAETGELVVWFGHCCSERIQLAGVLTEEEEITDPWEDVEEDPPSDCSACGKAKALVDTIYTIAEKIWENGTELWEQPHLWYGNASEAVPDVTLGIADVIDCTARCMAMALLVSEADVFDDDMQQWMVSRFEKQMGPDNCNPIGAETYLSLIQHAQDVWDDEGFKGIFNKGIGAIFAQTLRAIGRRDAQRITVGGAATVTPDCSEPGSGDEETEPLETHYYLSANLAYMQQNVDDSGWEKTCVRTNAPHHVYGCLITIETTEDDTIKRMALDPALFGAVEVSMFSDSSDHLENEDFHLGIPLVAMNTTDEGCEEICEALAAQLGFETIIKKSTAGTPPLGTPRSDKGEVIGTQIDGQVEPLTFDQFRLIYKADDDSH